MSSLNSILVSMFSGSSAGYLCGLLANDLGAAMLNDCHDDKTGGAKSSEFIGVFRGVYEFRS